MTHDTYLAEVRPNFVYGHVSAGVYRWYGGICELRVG
jgi:hypothetical protein